MLVRADRGLSLSHCLSVSLSVLCVVRANQGLYFCISWHLALSVSYALLQGRRMMPAFSEERESVCVHGLCVCAWMHGRERVCVHGHERAC